MSSTLVETVSINYEDFSDSFLTCGTCLCIYNNEERTPKLLSCSHTVCQSCLEHIIEAQGQNSTTFRCPICRETITIPRGGVTSFPPSFIVNQLLDLMGRQRRDIIPKCAQHSQTELMFCETCDVVFCVDCTDGSHNTGGASAHTIIPFSIAIKRMSEILLYKASLCMKNLDGASDVVNEEINKLDNSTERCIETVIKVFQDLASQVEKRKLEVIQMVKKVRDEKKKSLKEQLDIIESEKRKVQADCQGLQHQVEVRNITAKIGDLNEKLDISATLMEPRENAFMQFEHRHNGAMGEIQTALSRFGKITISKTFPALCTATEVKIASVHLRYLVTITTVDYHGNMRTTGGDPVEACMIDAKGDSISVGGTDNDDGTYTLSFTPVTTGIHHLQVHIFDRPIKDSPFQVEVTEHINPVAKVGSSGSGNANFKQPVSILFGNDKRLYVLDTGNSRIKVFDDNLRLERQIVGQGLEQHSATGMALVPQSGDIVLANWRTKHITQLTSEGVYVNHFTSDKFVEPIAVTVNHHCEVIVADNGVGKLFMFDSNGSLLNTFGSKGDRPGQFKLITSLYATANSDIIVCDNRMQVYSRTGQFLYEITADSGIKGTYGGSCVDKNGHYLATRSEKGRCIVQVFAPNRRWLFDIDSFSDRLKRPSGLVASGNGHVFVVDLGNDCIKKFRYM